MESNSAHTHPSIIPVVHACSLSVNDYTAEQSMGTGCGHPYAELSPVIAAPVEGNCQMTGNVGVARMGYEEVEVLLTKIAVAGNENGL